MKMSWKSCSSLSVFPCVIAEGSETRAGKSRKQGRSTNADETPSPVAYLPPGRKQGCRARGGQEASPLHLPSRLYGQHRTF